MNSLSLLCLNLFRSQSCGIRKLEGVKFQHQSKKPPNRKIWFIIYNIMQNDVL